MSTSGPARARQSYRHEAFLWGSRAAFVRGLIPFIEEGVDAGEAVMVAVVPEHTQWLCDDLGVKASAVHFVDMTELGRNPASIIPAWQGFLAEWSGAGAPGPRHRRADLGGTPGGGNSGMSVARSPAQPGH